VHCAPVLAFVSSFAGHPVPGGRGSSQLSSRPFGKFQRWWEGARIQKAAYYHLWAVAARCHLWAVVVAGKIQDAFCHLWSVTVALEAACCHLRAAGRRSPGVVAGKSL
jgi:hypothetical protein